jgi:hypothetical protein
MHIAFALFADAANLSQEGKLNVLGVFDAVQVGGFPSVHPRATLVVRIKGTSSDVGTHPLTLSWRSPRGAELWSSAGQIEVGPPPPGVGEMDFPLIAAVDLPVDAPGDYVMRIALGERGAGTEIGLQVRGPTVVPPALRPPAPGGGLVS